LYALVREETKMNDIGMRTVLGIVAAGVVVGLWGAAGLLTPTLMVKLAFAGGVIGFVGDVLTAFAKE
jgi:hypothetical protein